MSPAGLPIHICWFDSFRSFSTQFWTQSSQKAWCSYQHSSLFFIRQTFYWSFPWPTKTSQALSNLDLAYLTLSTRAPWHMTLGTLSPSRQRVRPISESSQRECAFILNALLSSSFLESMKILSFSGHCFLARSPGRAYLSLCHNYPQTFDAHTTPHKHLYTRRGNAQRHNLLLALPPIYLTAFLSFLKNSRMSSRPH